MDPKMDQAFLYVFGGFVVFAVLTIWRRFYA